MRYYLVEGFLKDINKMNETIMLEHQAYTQKAMEEDSILISGLKQNDSGALFIIKVDTLAQLNEYLDNEPFKMAGIQEYKVTEFDYHYLNCDWQ